MNHRRPIFVVGFQRSGTTLLQALLGGHPRIAAPPESYFVFRIARLADYYGDLADDSNLRRALHDTIATALFSGCGFDEERLFERARSTDRTYSALLDTVMTDFAERHGKARWSDKSPGQRARAAFKLFPDAQAIHIVRDPRDVIASSLATPWTEAGAAALARSWLAFTSDNVAVGREAGPDRFHQVRYEELTRDPETILRTLCAFLGEEFDEGILRDTERRRPTIAAMAAPWQARALEPVAPSVTGGWKSRLARRDIARTAAVLDRQIRALGYEPPTRADVAFGHALEAITSVARRPGGRRPGPVDPASRHQEVQRFLREQAEAVGRSREGRA